MRNVTRKWAYRAIVPVLGLGLLSLVLLPAAPARVAHVEAARAAAAVVAPPAAAAEPVFVKTSLIVPANEHTAPLPPAPGTVVPVVHLLPNWSDYIKPSAALAAAGPTTDGQVGSEAVNAHSGPGGGALVSFVLAAGEAVRIAETNGNWVHVYRQTGENGWVYGHYLVGHDAAAATAPDAMQASATQASATQAPAGPSAVSQTASADSPSARTPDPGNARLVGRRVRVRDAVPVRAAPGNFAAIVTVIAPGDAMSVTDLRDGWLRVTTDDGVTGWVPG